MNKSRYLIIFIILCGILAAGCTQSSGINQGPAANSSQQSNQAMLFSVSSVINGSTLPTMYTCAGPGQVPAVFWKNVPSNAQSLVLIVDDPDAPDKVFTHWIVYDLSPDSGGIPPNQLPVYERAGSGYQGLNSMGNRGYAAPCPSGGKIHRYVFTLYALDTQITPELTDRTHIEAAMGGHVITKAQIVTLFGR